MESIASYKRNGSILDGRSAHTDLSSKGRQGPPPDGASSMNPRQSPPYSDRFSKLNGQMAMAGYPMEHQHNDW